MNTSRKVIAYIAMSVDGYIADREDNIGFLDLVKEEGEDYGYSEFVKTIDTVIVGRRTYEKVLEMGFEYPHTDKQVYIVTRSPKPSLGLIQFYSGDLRDLVTELKTKKGKDIYCDGGAHIINMLLNAKLVDELILSVVPVLLGDGISLFNDGRQMEKLALKSVKTYEKGLVQLHYERD
jgi:dihydrofolate reductase